ncbi:MAG: ATP-binding protein, partial [Candidatus Hydrothermarchaeales archaeon]
SSEEELKQAKPKNLYKDEKRRKELLKILEEKGGISNFELEARRKDGKIIILNISAKAYGNHGEKSRYIEGIIQDVTEQKRLERRLMDYTAKLEHSNKFKDLFTDILRHDLINPLNVIQNMSELMEDTDDFYEVQEDLKTIKRNVMKLQEMIDTAATLAKVESMEKLKFKRRDLGRIIAEAIENVEGYAEDKNIKIVNKVKGQHIAYASLFIEEVFTNLLTNAIKYSPRDSKIVVNIVDHKGNWKVMVKDYGVGVPDKYKESIFSRFKRMEKKGVKGTGLGLAIVKRIVDLHDGRVWVDDNPDKGSIFCVDLPKEPTSEKRLGREYPIEPIIAK